MIAKVLRVSFGVLLCIAGVILGPVPIIPGFVFFGAGLALLARDVPWVNRRVRALLARWRLWRLQRRRRRRDRKSAANRRGGGAGS